MGACILCLVFLQLLGRGRADSQEYSPDWESLDARPLPTWFDEAKFGIFVHWGVFSVPSYKSEWYWWSLVNDRNPDYVNFHERQYRRDFKYEDFAAQFKAGLFKPEDWANLFKDAGAKYVVLTTKHHEGFTLWPSKYSWNWNSVDVGPHRDLVGELTNAVRGAGLQMGLYNSLLEWFHPLYLQDKANNFGTRNFPMTKLIPELQDLVRRYKPSLIWSDGNWDANETYWGSREFLAWLYNDSPVKDIVVVNDRWCQNCSLHHGGYYSGADRQQADPKLLHRKWESACTVDSGSWGYSRVSELMNYRTAQQLLRQLVSTVAYGGNFLLNVGPTSDGIILPIFEERLRQIGSFLNINGEAIYGTKAWAFQNETVAALDAELFYTKKDDTVYALLLPAPRLPVTINLKKVNRTAETTVSLLTKVSRLPTLHGGHLESTNATSDGSLTVEIPEMPGLDCHGIVLKLMHVQPIEKDSVNLIDQRQLDKALLT